MLVEQSMTQVIMQAETGSAKAAIMAITEAGNLFNNTRPIHAAQYYNDPPWNGKW